MKAIGLIYHDVTPVGERGESGFQGIGFDHYKLSPEQFARHLDAIAAAGVTPSLVNAPASPSQTPLLLTFDDGGACVPRIARGLAERGWLAHFFIVTGLIGTPRFEGKAGLLELRSAGHLLGSHSHTHPFMTRLGDDEIREEWRRSKGELEDLLGESVTTLSVPTGFYSSRVGRIAVETGYRTLFLSEPWVTPRRLGEALLYGRFSVVADTPVERVTALCRGSGRAILKEVGVWKARKAARMMLGPLYGRLRRTILAGKERAAG